MYTTPHTRMIALDTVSCLTKVMPNQSISPAFLRASRAARWFPERWAVADASLSVLVVWPAHAPPGTGHCCLHQRTPAVDSRTKLYQHSFCLFAQTNTVEPLILDFTVCARTQHFHLLSKQWPCELGLGLASYVLPVCTLTIYTFTQHANTM